MTWLSWRSVSRCFAAFCRLPFVASRSVTWMENVVLLIVSARDGAYLVFALIRPERF